MPAARESPLNAALTALGELPWSGVRMVDVAAAAASRQTLHNEFGSKTASPAPWWRRGHAHCDEPESCRPTTPTITSVMETTLSTETTSFRKTMP